MNDAAPRLDDVLAPSEDVVARTIEGELILVPLTADVGDLNDDLFTLNGTGRAVWGLLDGRRTLAEVRDRLLDTWAGPPDTVAADVLGFAAELLARRMLVCR